MTISNIPGPLKRNAKRLTAIAMLVSAIVAYHLANVPAVANLSQVQFPYAFSRHTLPEVPGPEKRLSRPMHPEFAHIVGFMSTLGAAVALADIDGDGLPNDICYVDTRTDQIIVAPAPGTGDRFKPFALNPNLREPLYTRTTMGPMGCVPGDVDEDGRTDLLVYYAGRTPILFLSRPKNENDPPSADNFIPVDIIPGGEVVVTGSAAFADLDGTGHLELILANYFQDGGDILNTAGTEHVYLPNALGTADNGGGPRIYRCLPKTEGAERTVGCTQVANALPQGLVKGWGLAVGTQDLDGDLYPEIFIANDFGPDQLLWNRSTPGHIKFDLVKGPLNPLERTQNSLGRDSFKGMGVDFADLNGDGIPDIGVSSISEHELMESHQVFLSTGKLDSFAHGVAPYTEHGDELGLQWSGWAWDIKFDDFNNKGWPDVVQATGFLKGTVSKWPEIQEISISNDLLLPYAKYVYPVIGPNDDIAGNDKNPFYVRTKPSGPFANIADNIGFGEDAPSRAVAIADVDGSGRLSMAVANMWAPSTFYRNECSPCGQALELSVRYPVSPEPDTQTVLVPGYPVKSLHTRPAINAEVEVTTSSGQRQVAQVDGGNGHGGKRNPNLHFGLGTETTPSKVVVKWRADGQVRQETFELKPGWYTVILGSTPIKTGAIEPTIRSASAR